MWRVACVIAFFGVLAALLRPASRERTDATPKKDPTSEAAKIGPEAPYPRLAAEDRRPGAPIWTSVELAKHSGLDRTRPLLLAIVGEVYDVGPGERHYGPNSGYHGMAGKDASRSFTTGNFKDDAVPGLQDLSPEQLQDVISWRSFYRKHEQYRFVGFLDGVYYNKEGHPTKALKKLEAIDDKTQKQQKVQQELRSRFKGCNSRTSQDKPESEIWCDDSYHGKGTRPVFLSANMVEISKEDSWCACLSDAQMTTALEKPDPKIKIRLAEYPECAGKQRCFRPKGAKSPLVAR
ncbi:unnamed protein product [Cladocopium goreaui]|uniref:H(+)-exporting diphosphatase n=1 Tax=Cladocopium goreaui TaxID=2562237 RepID=A0A9P1C856_9DINO|nr:unnamed protein product [Cladocopium goreaui]